MQSARASFNDRESVVLETSSGEREATVRRRRDGRTTLTQTLAPWCVGETVVDDEGRTHRVVRLALALEGGTPSLVIELEASDASAESSGIRTIVDEDGAR